MADQFSAFRLVLEDKEVLDILCNVVTQYRYTAMLSDSSPYWNIHGASL